MISENIQNVYNIVGILANVIIALTIPTYLLTKKQLNASIMSKCIEEFRLKYIGLNEESDIAVIKGYIDLVNEELFYTEKKYLEYEVAFEWVDGMIDNMPVYYKNKNKNDSSTCLKIIDEQRLLTGYPRVLKAFTINTNLDFEQIFSSKANKTERKKLITIILKNVGVNRSFFSRLSKKTAMYE
jgi:hypothetical protein